MFSLEAIKAKHGDCLLLHWGNDNNHKVALIHGGPDTVYSNFLKPRLQELAEQRGKKELQLTMVSHIDDDHINGVLALARDIEDGDAPADIGLLWHNSLEGLLDQKITGGTAEVIAAANAVRTRSKDLWAQKVLASVPQGQELFVFAKRHGISDIMNDPFAPLVTCKPNQKTGKVAGLAVRIVAPAATEVSRCEKNGMSCERKVLRRHLAIAPSTTSRASWFCANLNSSASFLRVTRMATRSWKVLKLEVAQKRQDTCRSLEDPGP